MSNVLTYFAVDGYWYSIDAANPKGAVADRRFLVARGLVDFIPRVPQGFSVFVNELALDGNPASPGVDTSVSIPAYTGRIWNGRLSTINVEDTPTVELLAASTALGLDEEILPDTDGQLIYDVRFRNVVYNQAAQALKNFAFVAPATDTIIVLTDDELERLPYEGPR